jgi:hypothetical protein
MQLTLAAKEKSKDTRNCNSGEGVLVLRQLPYSTGKAMWKLRGKLVHPRALCTLVGPVTSKTVKWTEPESQHSQKKFVVIHTLWSRSHGRTSIISHLIFDGPTPVSQGDCT